MKVHGTPGAAELDAVAGALCRGASDGVAVVGADGIIRAANPALEAALGAARGALVGQPLRALVDPLGDATLESAVATAAAGGTWRGEVRGVGADGVWDVVLAPLAGADGVGAIFRDERERHARERERLDFLSMVTHDIKGPLTVVLGYAELLADPDEVPSREETVDTLGRIHECGQQIHALVSNFIELSRIQAGRQQAEPRPLDLAEVLERLVAQQSGRATRQKVALELVCDDLPPVPADRHQLERIVGNLLGNALKYTPPGGRVRVRAARDDRAVTVAIEDTGPGIAAAELPTIFEKYRRGPAGRRVEGVGLGLFIARTLARLHGGDVTVESTPGAGSTFTLRLPLASPPAA